MALDNIFTEIKTLEEQKEAQIKQEIEDLKSSLINSINQRNIHAYLDGLSANDFKIDNEAFENGEAIVHKNKEKLGNIIIIVTPVKNKKLIKLVKEIIGKNSLSRENLISFYYEEGEDVVNFYRAENSLDKLKELQKIINLF